MANAHNIPRTHLVGVAALALFSALVADYMWFRLSQKVLPTVELPSNTVMDEISDIVSARWAVKGGN